MANQFLSLNLAALRSPEFRKIRPASLKVYLYMRSQVLRDYSLSYFRQGKLVCHLSRQKIQADTGLSAFQIRRVIEDLKSYGIKAIRTGRSCYFILGERKVVKGYGAGKEPVENFYLESRLIPRSVKNNHSDERKTTNLNGEQSPFHINKELININTAGEGCGKKSSSKDAREQEKVHLLKKLTRWFSSFDNIRHPAMMSDN